VLGDDFRRSAIGLRGEELDDGGSVDSGHSGTFRTCGLLTSCSPATSRD
jgi:hypothetical protein